MMGWNKDELMIESYLDMRVACTVDTMRQLEKQGWKILNTMRIGGERRYTMVLPERISDRYCFREENALERFRKLVQKPQRPFLRRVA